LLVDGLRRQIDAHNQKTPQRPFALEVTGLSPEKLRERINAKELYAYLVAPADVVDGDTPFEFGRRGSQLEARRQIEDMVHEAVTAVRFAQADPPMDVGRVRLLERDVHFHDVDVTTGAAAGNEMAALFTPFIFMLFLFMGTLNISQGLLTSLIEEKSTRVVELLLSAVTPTQLMAGKILGMVTVGALLMVVWTTVGYLSASSFKLAHLVSVDRLVYLALYFVPGFLLVSALLAGIGAACNTIKDAQSLAFPLTLVTIVPMMLWFVITQNPSSTLAVTLSFIPPITPFIMILRICSDPETPMWQIVLSLLLLWAAVGAAVWAAGKIFRVGVLMYGKAPTPAELIRWLRHD
jgi:ABC-2 type transport system permease protein